MAHMGKRVTVVCVCVCMCVCVSVCVCVCVSLALTKAARHYCSESPLAFPWAEASKGLMVG